MSKRLVIVTESGERHEYRIDRPAPNIHAERALGGTFIGEHPQETAAWMAFRSEHKRNPQRGELDTWLETLRSWDIVDASDESPNGDEDPKAQ